MRKSALIAAVVLVAGLVQADQIDWQANGMIYNSSGALVPEGSGYIITLWEDGGNNIIDAYGTGDDVQVAGLTGAFDLGPGSDGFFYSPFDPLGYPSLAVGDDVYTRVFNPGMTEFVTVDDALATIADSSGANPPWSYDAGGTLSNGSDWQPVPEPATLALLGIGLAGVASRRMRRK